MPSIAEMFVVLPSEPVDATSFYKKRPTPGPGGGRPRLHDLRHTFATMQLSTDVHFKQVSKWLGHSTFSLTLDIYGDYINEDVSQPAGLSRPVAVVFDDSVWAQRSVQGRPGFDDLPGDRDRAGQQQPGR
jgi:hypothetical protein